MSRFAVSRRADLDIHEIACYIDERSPDAATHFVTAANTTFQWLAETPGIGRTCGDENARLGVFRRHSVRGFSNYLIFYSVDEVAITIVRVLHAARDWQTLLQLEDD